MRRAFVAAILGALLYGVLRVALLGLHWATDYATFAASIGAVLIATAVLFGLSARRH